MADGYQGRVISERARHDSDRRAIDAAGGIVAAEKDGLGAFIEGAPLFRTLPEDEQARMKLQRRLQAEVLDASAAHSAALLALSDVLGGRIAAF